MRQVCWDQCIYMRQVCWDQCKWGGRGGGEYLSVHPRRRDYRQVCCTYEGRGGGGWWNSDKMFPL